MANLEVSGSRAGADLGVPETTQASEPSEHVKAKTPLSPNSRPNGVQGEDRDGGYLRVRDVGSWYPGSRFGTPDKHDSKCGLRLSLRIYVSRFSGTRRKLASAERVELALNLHETLSGCWS